MARAKVQERWREYLANISNEEFAHVPIPHTSPTYGPLQPISAEEVRIAPDRMKYGKATGPDGRTLEI